MSKIVVKPQGTLEQDFFRELTHLRLALKLPNANIDKKTSEVIHHIMKGGMISISIEPESQEVIRPKIEPDDKKWGEW
jgi:hypothetical protein